MTNRKIIILFLLVNITYNVNASPQSRDSLIIVNRTEGDIFIETEYLEKPRELGFFWTIEKQIGRLEVSINIFNYAAIVTLNSNRQILFFTTAPKWFLTSIDGRSPYEFLREIPLLDRIRTVVKTFKITNEQGDLLFSLGDAKEEDLVVRSAGGRSYNYYLEIQVR